MDGTASWSALMQLIGFWEGGGRGEFPTIDPFTYDEELTVAEAVPGETLHYLSRTWDTGDDFHPVSHVETGFITLTHDSKVDILNAQGPDRLEVLTGTLEPTMDGFTLVLRSTSITHDARMVTSWREWQLAADAFSYTMGMSTTVVPDGAHHLAAELRRQGSCSSGHV
ncbi:MAG: heme-binding beta-barrel domain-containing protein [Acidimicrobiia bacterium]